MNATLRRVQHAHLSQATGGPVRLDPCACRPQPARV